MGYRYAVLFAFKEPGYFASCPKHDSVMAREIMKSAGLSAIDAGEEKSFMEAMNLKSSQRFGIGAYEHGLFYSDYRLFGDVRKEQNPLLNQLFNQFGSRYFLFTELYETVNLFGYSLYDHGTLVRAMAGNIDDGIQVNIGAPHEAEKSYDICSSRPMSAGDGCQLAMEMTRIPFGVVFNAIAPTFAAPGKRNFTAADLRPAHWSLKVEVFEKAEAVN